MPPRYRCPLYLHLWLATLLTGAAVAATFPAAVATSSSAVATALDDEGGDEVGLMTVRTSRVWRAKGASMEPSAAARSLPVKSTVGVGFGAAQLHRMALAASGGTTVKLPTGEGFDAAQAHGIPLAANGGQVVVAAEKVVQPSSLAAFQLPGDDWLPGDDRDRVSSSSGPSTVTGLPALISALAQAQLWLACAGGIMIAFALNRARAGLTHYAQQSSQAKQSPLAQFGMSWRVDHNMVRSSALNSAG